MTTPHKHRQTVIDRAIAEGKTISDHDVSVSQTLKEVALDYVKTYKGTNSFVQSLAVYLEDRGSLSLAQMRGALNVMVGEYKAATRIQVQVYGKSEQGKTQYTNEWPAFYVDMAASRYPEHKPEAYPKTLHEQMADRADRIDPVTPLAPIVPNGTYTVPINDAGEYRVIRLSAATWATDQPAGTQWAEYQSGPDNTRDFTGFAFVYGDRFTLKRKLHKNAILEHALVKLLSTGKHAEFGRLWAMSAGRCFICGRPLTVPLSKKAGIGPICAANTGIDIVALAALAGDKDQAIEQNELRDKIDRQAKAQADIDELFPQ